MRHVGYIVQDDETGAFFLAPLVTALAKPVGNAIKALKRAKKLRKQAQKDVKAQARTVKAAASAPPTAPVNLPAEQSRLAQLRGKLSESIKAEAQARADLLQAKANEKIDELLPAGAAPLGTNSATVPLAPAPVSAPAQGVVIGNIYRPSSAGLVSLAGTCRR